MLEQIRQHLKDIASAFLGIGIAFSLIAGFILLVALDGSKKLIGLGFWCIGPAVSLLGCILIYGVAIKEEESRQLARKLNLLEANNKKLDKILSILNDDEFTPEKKEALKAELKKNAEEKKQANKYGFGNTTVAGMGSDVFKRTDKVASIFDEPKADTTIKEEKATETVESVTEIKEEEKDDNTMKIDYSTNISLCVLFNNALTLPYGDTVYLQYAYDAKRLGNNVIFTIEGKTYSIDMNDLYEASILLDKINKKEF